MKAMARGVAMGVWILLLLWLARYTVGLATQMRMLVWASLPLTLIPIIGLSILPAMAERVGWVLFTVWLGSTYAALGTPAELSVFALIALLGVLGYFLSPWFFVAAWFGHIVWDFFPRALPELFADLPMACMLFDGSIGLYLIWRILRGSLRPTPVLATA